MVERAFQRFRVSFLLAAAMICASVFAAPTAVAQQDRDDLYRRYAHDGVLYRDVFEIPPQLLKQLSSDGILLRSHAPDLELRRQIQVRALGLVNRNLHSDIYEAVRFYGHYFPDPYHYGRSTYVNKSIAQPPLAQPLPSAGAFDAIEGTVGRGDAASEQDATPAAELEPSQQPVLIEVATPEGGTKKVITSEPLPDKLREAWGRFADGDNEAAETMFSAMTTRSPHATDRSREATLGQLLSGVGAALSVNRGVDEAGARLNSALQSNPGIANLAPADDAVRARIVALVADARRRAEAAEDGAMYRRIADDLQRLGGGSS